MDLNQFFQGFFQGHVKLATSESIPPVSSHIFCTVGLLRDAACMDELTEIKLQVYSVLIQ